MLKAPAIAKSGSIRRTAPRAASRQTGRLPSASMPMRCPCGGGCPTCAAPTNQESLERGARRFGQLFARSSDAPSDQLTPPSHPAPRRAVSADAPDHVHAVVAEGGRPLDARIRTKAEPLLGTDLGAVRVHTGPAAAQSARTLRARAYATGADIVFANGAWQPDTAPGRALIGHELAHTVQQTESGTPALQRDEDPNAETPEAYSLPAGLTLFPGATRLMNIAGFPLRLPGALRLTNALGLGPGPSFALDVAPDALVLAMLQRIDLASSPTAGAAPGHLDDPNQQSRISLVRPILRLDTATGRIVGTATLQVPTGYPLNIRAPTELDVRIESTELGQFTGRIALGPLHADMNVRLHYDVDRLSRAAAPAFAPRGGLEAFRNRINGILLDTVPGISLSSLQDTLRGFLRSVNDGTLPAADFAGRVIGLIAESLPADLDTAALGRALSSLAQELSHPGFSLSGSLGLDLPFGLNLPLSTYSAEAPTTVPLDRPLPGAQAPFPLTTQAGGVIIAPPGAITDIAVPALGYAYSSYDGESGTSLTAAALPSLSPTAISTPGTNFAEQFPVYVFAEFTHVHRFGDVVDAGVRLTVQFSTPDLAGRTSSDTEDINARVQQQIQQVQAASRPGATDTPAVPNIGLTLFGNF
ncbi:protein of unknown function [Poseidonocella pacifica]|uniref:eCIS core domain-containing protein n=1 Tax=Poseidonocella pacifica TaxID=871651 RepID=A0A1I0VPV2_9RHOB|nr:DUF4157 domain-containing protein [Poseidonocella pacifica]SFA78331.1 protein of unknown function [Poseidonocella pacifica]